MDSIKCDLCGLWNEATEKACRRCGVVFSGRSTSGQQASVGAGTAYAKHFPDPIKKPRTFAGTWFANAASIPAGIFVLIVTLNAPNIGGFNNGVAFLAIAVPVIIAWVIGYYFGSKILDESSVFTSGRASAIGLGVAAISFVLYIALVSFIIAVADSGRDPVSRFFASFFLILFFGSILVGWFVALVGLTAGYSLYRYRLSHGVVSSP